MRFYYGYIIILASFIILMISWGAQYSFGVFFKPMLNEFGWTRAATSGAYSLNMVLMGGFSILAGRLNDRFGPRLVLTACGLLLGLGYLLMSRVSAIWQIYLFYGVLMSIGMSGTYVPLMSTAIRWFVKRKGLASGIVIAGVGVGIIIMPPLANLLISSYRWQTSYAILGLITLALVVILAQFLRRAPIPKAPLDQAEKALKRDSPDLLVQGLSLPKAVRTRQFWIICVMGLFASFGLQTVMVHIVPHATDIGVSAAAAATILSVIGVVSISGKVALGSLGDRVGNRNIMIVVFILAALSLLWLIFAGELWMLYLFAVIFGLGYGGFSMALSPLVADYFGLKAHGAILGVALFATNIGAAIGSTVTGRIFDISGSYQWAFILCMLLGIASLILAVILKSARKAAASPD